MENMEVILTIVIVALTLLLVIVGIQVVLIISDMRKAIKKVNTILDDSVWGGGLLRPDKLSGLVEMTKKKKKLKTSKHGNIRE
ncbi:hypothetical protein ACFL2C_01775 [Patescibacteria group bacterium]